MIVLAFVALTAGVGGSFVAHFNYGWLSNHLTSGPTAPAGNASATASGGDDAAAPEGATRAQAAAPMEYGSFYEVENMIVNPAESQGSRYLMVNVGFESDADEVLTELEDKEVVVRDRVIKLLGEFTVPQLSDIDRRTFLKDTLRTSVNQVLQKGAVQRLYFTQYVLQ